MTNNIIEVSGAAIYSGLYELFIQFLLPVGVRLYANADGFPC